MISFFGYPLYVGIIFLALLLAIQRRKHGRAYLIAFMIFGFYLLLVVAAILFPMPVMASLHPAGPRASAAEILARVNFRLLDYGMLFSFQPRSLDST